MINLDWRPTRVLGLVALAAAITGMLSCSDDSKKKVVYTEVHALDVVDTVRTRGGSEQAKSQEAFRLTLHPITKKYCVGCHGGTFAGDDAAAAHDALMATGKVNLENPAESGIVARLKGEKHNCWSDCDKNGDEVAEAITKWADILKSTASSDATGAEVANTTLETGELGIGVELANPAELPFGPGTIVFEAESATLKAPFAAASDKAASGGKYVVGKTGGRAVSSEEATTDNSLGTLRYTFSTVGNQANYAVFMRVQANGAASDSFHVRIDDQPFEIFDLRPNDGAWNWIRLTRRIDPNNDVNLTPKDFTLAAGEHTIELRQRENGSKVDTIVITNDPGTIQPQLEGIEPTPLTRKTLSYNLSELLGGKRATFTVEVTMYNEESYLFTKPTLVTDDETIHVKNVKFLLNGTYSPEQSTYTVVDETVAPPLKVLSGAAMVAIASKGPIEDKFSWTFDILEVVADADAEQ